MSLLEQLSAHARTGAQPLHMPGHKRHGLDSRLPYEIDITEIAGFDDLHDPEGILAEGMCRAAALWGSDRCFYLVGGSTVGLLACVRAAAAPGQRVLIARNCHKSVYHAVELCGLRPGYLLPEWDDAFGIWGSVTPETLDTALTQSPDTALVVVTSPTYEGVRSDIAALAAAAHAHGAALLVDEAHGAHLRDGAVPAGADFVVQSLHKTLPSLTQTALCHCKAAYGDRVARELNVFETSSPSYPLMAAIELCVDWLARDGEAAFAAYEKRLAALDKLSLKNIRILCHCGDGARDFYGFDPGKLYLRAGCPGTRLAALLRAESIEPEMTAGDGVLLMTTVCDTDEDFAALEKALLAVDALVPPAQPSRNRPLPIPPQREIPGRAIYGRSAALPMEQAAGRTAAEYVWAYPPGVPLVVPGETLEPAALAAVERGLTAGLHMISTSGQLPRILALDD